MAEIDIRGTLTESTEDGTALKASTGKEAVGMDRKDELGHATPSTLYDVARVAGVSTATVSRVVHGHDRVRSSTRQRVLEVIDKLGYIPDGAAQSLSRRRKEVIGLVSVERLGP